jgi:hypothetical protein
MLNAAHSSSRSHSHCFRDILHMPVLLRPCLGKLSITHNSAWSPLPDMREETRSYPLQVGIVPWEPFLQYLFFADRMQ